MKNYIVKYTTYEKRDQVFYGRAAGLDYTKAYLNFIFNNPRGVMIIELIEDQPPA